jgi:hypothetical protein
MKKDGKAVDCVFLQKFIEFFCGIIYRRRKTEEDEMRGGDGWIRLQREF